LTAFFDELPGGLMLYRYDQPLFANRAFLVATGFSDLDDLIAAGGLGSLSLGTAADATSPSVPTGQALTIVGRDSAATPIAARLIPVPWGGENALALVLDQSAAPDPGEWTELAMRRCEAQIRELRAIIETAYDGLIVLSRDRLIL